jgi:hypothetical protein
MIIKGADGLTYIVPYAMNSEDVKGAMCERGIEPTDKNVEEAIQLIDAVVDEAVGENEPYDWYTSKLDDGLRNFEDNDLVEQ